MKKIIIMLFIALFAASGITLAQQKKTSAEVLYFKANLACCKARACNALETDVKTIVEKNWTDGKVVFRQVKLSDTVNNALIKKYNAKSQSLVIVVTKKKKETSSDVSVMLSDFVAKHDTATFEKDLTAKIKEMIK
jgi:hypothetical protein